MYHIPYKLTDLKYSFGKGGEQEGIIIMGEPLAKQMTKLHILYEFNGL